MRFIKLWLGIRAMRLGGWLCDSATRGDLEDLAITAERIVFLK